MVLATESGQASVHEQLAAYVSALSGGGARGAAGVWSEHSYARAAAPAPRSPRTLLGAPPAAAGAPLVVDGEPEPAPALPLDAAPPPPAEADDEDEWEERVAALAPSAAHARLAARAVALLRDLRLARLATAGPPARHSRALRKDQAHAAAIKLRHALAPTWAWGGGGGGSWLQSVLLAYLPAAQRALFEEVLAELRRAAPRLAARLPGPAAAPDPLAPGAPAAARGPLLLWVSAGRERADARWERRLAALLPTRALRAAAPAPAPPDRWGAALAAGLRAALADALADAGSRPVVLGGFGAGAALAAALAGAGCGAGGGAGVRGAALLAPPLLTAEGARDAADDGLLEARVPLLLVAGAGGAGRAAALGVAAAAPLRRLVLLEGADAALRLPARLRLGLRVPQPALDAAVADEVYRWANEVVDTETSDAAESGGDEMEEEEYAHLPPAAPGPEPRAELRAEPREPPKNPGIARAIEIVEGRVVSRGSGATPLVLPRRAAPAPAPAAAPPAPDIMSLPIVFADDEPAAGAAGRADVTEAGDSPVTVTSGARGGRAGSALQYTRVIVAKRGGGGAGGAGGRPVLLRRAVRVVGRGRPPDR